MKRRGGFNAMDPARAKEIQSLGGKAAHAKGVAPKWNSETGRKAGKKGGGKNSEEYKIRQQIKELRDAANRMEESVSSNAGPSSQEWVNPERRQHYYQMAAEKRLAANKLEKQLE